ncbi:MAG: hypothetical protein Tsb002_13210 [Wenzhouxiangellaceae bacterium]
MNKYTNANTLYIIKINPVDTTDKNCIGFFSRSANFLNPKNKEKMYLKNHIVADDTTNRYNQAEVNQVL